ncbi:hypothetical protein CTAYLR_001254 [Chrysophaeum taylorii]|uniref:Cytosol aminopeptidase domain-containing protein n=1 Tax=Chrysophaeum taylorii TaxID=2483200 RepID=A0AAD7UER5_9STRA|nr:hypothetical protein CTAYLR_001254 [Chrysophaeum taylorii]
MLLRNVCASRVLVSAAAFALRSQGATRSRTVTMSAAVANVPLTSPVSDNVNIISCGDVGSFRGDALVLPVYGVDEGETGVKVEGAVADADAALDGAVSELAADFKGGAGKSSVVRLSTNSPVRKVALFGLGKADESATNLAKLGAFAAGLSKSDKTTKVVGIAPLPDRGWDDSAVDGVARGALEACYVDNRFRTGDNVADPPALESIALIGAAESPQAAADAGRKIARGVALARDLVGAPANVVTPRALADVAYELRDSSPFVSCEVLDRAACEERNMGSYLGVANGAADERGAQFIHLTYEGPASSPDEGSTPRASLVLIGKGLTYDSGGYNLKPSQGGMIELMKFDMGGAAAVLGTASAIAALEIPDVTVHVIVAACENMVSADSMRPGDILTASNGKTIEVINTDAEGRLTLADALVYAEKECNPQAIIDVATLTGACIVALGDDVAGLFSSDDALARELDDAAKAVDEKMWRMPLVAEYNEALKSKIADLKNASGSLLLLFLLLLVLSRVMTRKAGRRPRW